MNFDKECNSLTEPLRHRLKMLMYFGPKIGINEVLKRQEIELYIYQLVYKVWQEKQKDLRAQNQINLNDYRDEIAAFIEQSNLPGYSLEKVTDYVAILTMDFYADMRRLDINQKSLISSLFPYPKKNPEKEFQLFRRVCLEHLENLQTIRQPFEFHGDFQIDNKMIKKYMNC